MTSSTPPFVFLQAVDIRDWGLINETTIELETLDDLEEILEDDGAYDEH